jgi:hypothetical protein
MDANKKVEVVVPQKKMATLLQILRKYRDSCEQDFEYRLAKFGDSFLLSGPGNEDTFPDSLMVVATIEDTNEHRQAVDAINVLKKEQRVLARKVFGLEEEAETFKKTYHKWQTEVPPRLAEAIVKVREALGINMQAVQDAFRPLGIPQPEEDDGY